MVTVTGTVFDTFGQKANVNLVFKYRSSPAIITAGAIYSGIKRSINTSSSGTFSIVLPMGDYSMIIGGVDTFIISVPDNDSVYDFAQLLVGSVTQQPTQPAGSFEPDASPSVKGIITTTTIQNMIDSSISSVNGGFITPTDGTALIALDTVSTFTYAFLTNPETVTGSSGYTDPKILKWDVASILPQDRPNVYTPTDITEPAPGRWLAWIF